MIIDPFDFGKSLTRYTSGMNQTAHMPFSPSIDNNNNPYRPGTTAATIASNSGSIGHLPSSSSSVNLGTMNGLYPSPHSHLPPHMHLPHHSQPPHPHPSSHHPFFPSDHGSGYPYHNDGIPERGRTGPHHAGQTIIARNHPYSRSPSRNPASRDSSTNRDPGGASTPPKSGRAGVKRRQKYSRTRTGCLCCRARRIKCDEERPVCRRCVIAKKPVSRRTVSLREGEVGKVIH